MTFSSCGRDLTGIDERIHFVYFENPPMHDDPAAEFRVFLENWLRTTGWSQYQLGLAAEIGQSLISRWLSPTPGRRTQPSPETLMKLAPVVGRSYDDLWRMAGYQLAPSDKPAGEDPPELAALIADLRAGWHQAGSELRQVGADVTRAAFHIRKARRGRSESEHTLPMHERLDKTKGDYRMHNIRASLATALSM